jgi:O-antigen ligase
MSITLFQFKSKQNKTQIFLDQYQYILSIVATFLFFSDLPDYLFTAGILPVLPLVWIWAFVFLAIPFLPKIKTIPKPLVLWMLFYALISMLSMATINGDEVAMKEFKLRITSIMFICLMYILYEQKNLKHIKYAIIAVVIMSVATDFYELAVPKFFSELNTGRPAGFYINPNKAGCALVLGLIFTIDVIKKQYRWFYMFFVLAGIGATFSRGSILGWLLCTLFLTIAKVLSERRRTVVASVFVVVIALALINPIKLISDYFGASDGASWDVLDRLEQFQNPSLEDDSAKERKAVVGYALIMFSNHPYWGNGLASTHKWTVSDVSTHNQYLFYMADHGILGILFLPGAILAVIWKNKGQATVQIVCFAVFMSLWGVFSHNILEERYILSMFALLAAMNTSEKWYLKYSADNFRMAQAPVNGRMILPPARNIRAIGSTPNQRLLPPGESTLPPRRTRRNLPPRNNRPLLPPDDN